MKRSSSVLQRAIHAEPAQLRPRSKLAELAFAQGRPALAQALLEHLLDSSKIYLSRGAAESLRLLAIAIAASFTGSNSSVDGDEAIRLAHSASQKALMLAPWDRKNMTALYYVLRASALRA